jgi:hypothetical protein
MPEDDRLLTNPITQAREAGLPRTTKYNKLPAFPAINEVPGTGAPERVVTPDNVVTPQGTDVLPSADVPGGAGGEVVPFNETTPLDVQPIDTTLTRNVPRTVAQPGEEQPLLQLNDNQQQLTTPTLTQGEDASFNTLAGDAGITPVLPDVNRQQVLDPDILYGNVARDVRAQRTISTDIVNDWAPYVRRLSDHQRANAEYQRQQVISGANIRDQVNGSLPPVDLVNAQVAPGKSGAINVSGLNGIGLVIGTWLNHTFGGNNPDVNFTGFGDFGTGAVGAVIGAVSNLQNNVFSMGLDAANSIQAVTRAAVNTPLDINDFTANVQTYIGEFYRDGDQTAYYDRAQRGDDLGFSNYANMADGRINPLGQWGTEGDGTFTDAVRQTIDNARSLLSGQGYRSDFDVGLALRGGRMALGLVLDVITDPSDAAKAIARLTGGAREARTLGEAIQLSQRSSRTAAQEGVAEFVATTEVTEAVTAATHSQRMQATLPELNVPVRAPVNAATVTPNLDSLAMPPVTPARYYSPSAIVNDITVSNVAAPSVLRGTPEFTLRTVPEVVNDVLEAAPALKAELGALPVRSYAAADAIVAATVRSVGDEALNLVPNLLAPVNRQAPDVITSLANTNVKLDADTLGTMLPRNVGSASRTRLALYNNVSEDLTSLLPATPAPQRVYINAPERLSNNPLFPVSIDSARPLIDEAAAASNADSVFSRANRYLETLAKQGYVQRTPDYSAFVVSSKTSDIAYTNADNLVKVDNATAALRATEADYVKLAADRALTYRQTRLLEVLSPSVQRTPDMFNELASGYANKLPKLPTRTLAASTDSIIAAEDRFANAAQVLQRIEGEAANVNLNLRNTTFDTGYINRSGTVQKRSNGTVLRTSPTAAKERVMLRELADVTGVPKLQLDTKAAAPNTYVVDSLPPDARPLVMNGRLNVTPDELTDIAQHVDDLVVNLVDKGYVHFDIIDSLHVLPDGTVRLTDNLADTQRIDDIFYGVAEIDEIDEVRRVERGIATDRLSALRDNFDVNAYETGNAPRYTEGMFDNALARTVYEYDGAPSSLANANRLRHQTKYELERAAQLAKRELESASSARQAAIEKLRADVNLHNQRSQALTQTQLREKQRRVDDLLSKDRGACL